MKLYFYRHGSVANFGDELNLWLMPRIFPNFFDDDPQTLMLAIGSVLFDHHPKDSLKIVYGSGFGGYTKPPVLDHNWKVYCVRGPRTAKALGLGKEKIAADTAVLMHAFRNPFAKKRYDFAFIPHFETVQRGNWEKVCALTGTHFIDPRRPVDDVLADIEASKAVIAEAMHGAIVADALRVPWIPVLPFHPSHHWKWFDWAEALDINLTHHRLRPSSVREAFWLMAHKDGGSSAGGATSVRYQPPQNSSRHLQRPGVKTVVQAVEWGLAHAAAASLNKIKKIEPTLSPDLSLARAIDRLNTNAEFIRRDFARQASIIAGDRP